MRRAAERGASADRLDNDSRADLRFGTDAAGEIYVLTKRDGMIRKLSIAGR